MSAAVLPSVFNGTTAAPDSLMRDAAGVKEGDISGIAQAERGTMGSVTCRDQRFMLKDKQFDRQFSHIYSQRTVSMRRAVVAAARKRWGAAGQGGISKFKERIIDLEVGEEAALVGTLYKDMPKKPCVLNEYEDEDEDEFSVPVDNGSGNAGAGAAAGAAAKPKLPRVLPYSSAADTLVLEDGSGRVPLTWDSCEGGCPVGELVTGVVIAVEGKFDAAASFAVKRWCPAGVPPQTQAPAAATDAAPGSSGLLLLVSGLALGGNAAAANALPTQLLVDHVSGHLGGEGEQAGVSRIARVIVAGSSVQLPAHDTSSLAKRPSKVQQDAMAEPLRQVDLTLAEMAINVPIDVMPGTNDPANHALPQQPMHRCLFPAATRYSSFRCVTNPHEAVIGGAGDGAGANGAAQLRILGHAGQPLDDVLRSSAPGTTALEALERTLQWSHIAPTAPDTLSCYPFHDCDPFVLAAAPHVYFAGNQDAFATKLVEGEQGQRTRLICVPSFAATCTAVLLDVATLECEPIVFAVNGMHGADADAEMDEAPPSNTE